MTEYCKLSEKNRCVKTELKSENDKNCKTRFKTKRCVKKVPKSLELSFDAQWRKRAKDFQNHENTIFKYKGYQCEILKSANSYWSGYVSFSGFTRDNDYDKFGHYGVHGGITFVGQRNGKIRIGFDCSHLEDFNEYDRKGIYAYNKDSKFRTFHYVKLQIQNLVNQIIIEGIYKP